MQKIGGAIERIDDPAVGLVAPLAPAAFLAEKTVAGPRFFEVGVKHFLGALVGQRDEIRRTLQRHLQVLDLAEIAFQAAAGAARGLDHDVNEGGMQHEGGFVLALDGGGERCREKCVPCGYAAVKSDALVLLGA